MALKRNKPTTPSKRHLVQIVRSELLKVKPIRSKTYGLNKKGGRNHHGKVTSFHRGGGHKRRLRLIDFKRLSSEAEVLGYEYDPNRSAWIVRAYDKNTQKDFYIIAPKGLSKDTVITSGDQVDIKPGNHTSLKNMPIGTSIHNIEMKPGKGGQLIRSAGCSGSLIQKTDRYARVRLPSGIQRLVPLKCSATVGSVSNNDYKIQTIGKAGRSRWLSRRPKVRGVAMNPIDHPHGGGEGKTSGGRSPVSPWGQSAKGLKTRRPKRSDKLIITRRKKRKK